MTHTRTLAPAILAAALGLGIAADQLFRTEVWGLNVTIFLIGVAAWGASIGFRARRLSGLSYWPWAAASSLALMWVLRETEVILVLNLLAALCLLTLPQTEARGIALASAGAVDLALSPPTGALRSLTQGAAVAVRDLAWRDVLTSPHGRRLPAIAGGLFLSVPIVLVFGSLFASADATFEHAVSFLLEWPAGTLLGHAAVITGVTWLAAGYLRSVVATDRRGSWPVPQLSLGAVPVSIAVASMVLVFTLFAAVQAGTLFQGEAYIQEQVGVTYAEFARRGFFQLVAASGLALPVVYGATWLAGALEGAALRSLRALQTAALGLVVLTALSALWRLWLYVEAYGLTLDRLMGTAVIAWIGATIGVFGRTILAGRPQGTAHGAMVAAVIVLALLNLVNPSALIARVNLARADGRGLDHSYLTELGAEAVPVVAANVARLEPEARCSLGPELVKRWSAEPQGDWRGWSLARARARAALPVLERAVASCPPPPVEATAGAASP
jgi:hypothetical protein